MKISIITPSYNSEPYIGETIRSINNQSYRNFEHIIVDGLSQDGTLSIVKQHPHIRVVSEKDRGQSDAINKGLKLATGDILAWQNADDLYLPRTLEIIVDYFKRHPETDVVYGYYQLVDSGGKWICDVYPNEWNTWLFSHGRFCPLQPTVFWRRQVSDAIGLLDEQLHYCMDVDFFSRMVNAGVKFSRIPQILGQFRVHGSSKTQNVENERKVIKEYEEVLSKNFTYTFIDTFFFHLFQRRAKLSKFVKQRFLKRL